MNVSRQGSTTQLVADAGRPSTTALVGRFLGAEVRGRIRALSIRLGIRKLYEALPADWEIPDSKFAQQAVAAAQELCPDFMIRHCFRSYCFGAILAARNQLKLDRETFFIAAMLHDLALSDKHANDSGSFEWVGAKLAYDFCIEAEQLEQRATTIHNAIALHTSLGIAQRYEPEIAMLHFGTAMDLFGMRVDEIPPDILQLLLNEYPRSEFKAQFSPCLAHQASSKPDSHIAGAVGVGIIERIKEELRY
ncbi:MAG: HD domain-containing protein [Pseudomonadales bacterium]